VEKPSWTWCRHCDVENGGCKIYTDPVRPKICDDFRCLWLDDLEQPDEWRPDKMHLYVSGKLDDDVLRVVADDLSYGFPVLQHYKNKGHHLLISAKNSLLFLPGDNRDPPAKLIVDWVL